MTLKQFKYLSKSFVIDENRNDKKIKLFKSICNFILLCWSTFLSYASGDVNRSPTYTYNHTNFPNEVLVDDRCFKIVAQKL